MLLKNVYWCGPFLAVCAMFATATAQNTIPIPDKFPVGTMVAVDCNCPVPEGGRLEIVEFPSDAVYKRFGTTYCVWGEPGEYVINNVAFAVKTITVEDQEFDVIAGPPIVLYAKYTIEGEQSPDPPDPGPDPEPNPMPFDAPGLTVIVMYETNQKDRNFLPPEQQAFLKGDDLLLFARDVCHVYPGDPPRLGFARWDDDYSRDEFASSTPQPMLDGYFALRESADSLPWIGISNGDTGFSGPLPQTLDETMSLIQQYAQ